MKTNALEKVKAGLELWASNVKLNLKEASPEIFLVGGIASIIGGAIMASYATLKAEETLAIHENEMDMIAKAEDIEAIHSLNPNRESINEYTPEDASKDRAVSYLRNIGRFAKLYAPSVLLIGGGIAMICASHGIMKKRNAALTAAYNAVSMAFNQYRGRVRAENPNGELLDRHYMTGREYAEVADPKTGETRIEEKASKEEVEGVSPDKNLYTKCFDESSRMWKKDPEYNLITLRCVQSDLNFRLQRKGYVFLNELYEALDIPATSYGQLVGWRRPKPGEPPVTIDLGIYDLDDERKRAFVNGYERCIWICPNVQGVVYDLL